LEPIAACPDNEGLVVKLADLHAFAPREAMIFWNGQHIWFFEENPTREIQGAPVEIREHSG
jgi:hypothetical protein